MLPRLCGLWALFFVGLPVAFAQVGPLVARIEIKHVGPPAVSDELIRANIRTKPGDSYIPSSIDADVLNLYGTGFFHNIQVTDRMTEDGVVLTYIVLGKPLLTDVKFEGNRKYSNEKLRKQVTSKVGEPLDEHKLFKDAQAIKKLYEKAGYPRTEVRYLPPNIDENAGRGTVTFEIKESPKIKVERVEFIGAQAFPARKLRRVIKTGRAWYKYPFFGGTRALKEDQFAEDKERLAQFYRERGYIDFELKDVQFEQPTPKRMAIRFFVFEGKPYKVGAIEIKGDTLFPTNELHAALKMNVGDTFTPAGLSNNIVAIENYYGARGHIDVTAGSSNFRIHRVPNTQTGTMDLQYNLNAGEKVYIEKIDIRGNTKTKDRVIRRELAVTPGETFDMVRVKRSKARLQNLQYFEKVDTRAEPSDAGPNRRNLIVGVEEKNTGNMTLGAGFSSVDAVVGFAEVSQGNFDLFHPPTFTGAGQKFRLRVQLGTRRQDYTVSFVEPWFLGRKLALGVDLFHREWRFQSLENLYDESRTGARLSLARALWSDFAIGSISYNIENVGIDLDSSLHGPRRVQVRGPGRDVIFVEEPGNAPQALLDEKGDTLISSVRLALAYDTRNSTRLPDAGQRTEFSTEVAGGPLGGDRDFYKLELRTVWYFKGLFEGHVLELAGRAGVADAYGQSDSVPFYERWYLGGPYSLRGYRYREISPREPGFDEPVGGNTYWFGSAEYSVPIVTRLRFALFYDIGHVLSDAYDFEFSDYADNWGVGVRLDLPIGPLRLDYGIPISHPDEARGGGRFQFSVGYTREF